MRKMIFAVALAVGGSVFAVEPAANVDLRRSRCHLTDAVRTYTEVPLIPGSDGSYIIRMQPNSFALVEAW